MIQYHTEEFFKSRKYKSIKRVHLSFNDKYFFEIEERTGDRRTFAIESVADRASRKEKD